jgi:hypothetical protein
MPPKYWVRAAKRASSSQPLIKKIAAEKMSIDEIRRNKRDIGFFSKRILLTFEAGKVKERPLRAVYQFDWPVAE